MEAGRKRMMHVHHHVHGVRSRRGRTGQGGRTGRQAGVVTERADPVGPESSSEDHQETEGWRSGSSPHASLASVLGFSPWRLLPLCSAGLQHPGVSSCGSWALQHGLRGCGHMDVVAPWRAGILLDQGLNPCPLHWQAVSLPLSHQGGPFPSTLKGSWPRVLAGGESGHT